MPYDSNHIFGSVLCWFISHNGRWKMYRKKNKNTHKHEEKFHNKPHHEKSKTKKTQQSQLEWNYLRTAEGPILFLKAKGSVRWASVSCFLNLKKTKIWEYKNRRTQNRCITFDVVAVRYSRRAHFKPTNQRSQNSIWSVSRNSAVRSVWWNRVSNGEFIFWWLS